MTDWQERITVGTDPSVRVEHVLRYASSAPIVAGAATWCDLGCGTGLAAAHAIDGAFDGRLVLVDVDAPSVAEAAAQLRAGKVVALVANLNDAEGRAAVRAALLAGDAPRAITCFEVLEHLADLPAVVELLVELATEHDTTVLMSVPNDAFWAIENPYHETMWSPAAFAELRQSLPADHALYEQLPLRGSRIVAHGDGRTAATAAVQPHDGAVASHLLAAFGPRAHELQPAAVVFEADQRGERTWTRERESHLAYAEVLIAERDEWRRYIHELEGRLGLPLSGGGAAAASERPVAP